MRTLGLLIVLAITLFQVASAKVPEMLDEQYYFDIDQVVKLLEKHGNPDDIDLALKYLIRDEAQFDFESLIFPAALCLFACVCCCIKKSCVLAFPYTKKLPIIRDIVKNVNEARDRNNEAPVSAPMSAADESV